MNADRERVRLALESVAGPRLCGFDRPVYRLAPLSQFDGMSIAISPRCYTRWRELVVELELGYFSAELSSIIGRIRGAKDWKRTVHLLRTRLLHDRDAFRVLRLDSEDAWSDLDHVITSSHQWAIAQAPHIGLQDLTDASKPTDEMVALLLSLGDMEGAITRLREHLSRDPVPLAWRDNLRLLADGELSLPEPVQTAYLAELDRQRRSS